MLENSGMTPFLQDESVAHITFELTPKLSGKSTSLLCCCLHTCVGELAWVYHCAELSQCEVRACICQPPCACPKAHRHL